jgi:hypothetical protein
VPHGNFEATTGIFVMLGPHAQRLAGHVHSFHCPYLSFLSQCLSGSVASLYLVRGGPSNWNWSKGFVCSS